MSGIDVSALTESETIDLFFQLRSKFDWCGSPTAMGDVIVHRAGEDPWWDEDAPEMTPAMREAVRETYEWRKAIDERCSEVANSMAPRIEVFPDGGFAVHTESSPIARYSADGQEIA